MARLLKKWLFYKLIAAACGVAAGSCAAQSDTEFDRLIGNGELPSDSAGLERFSEYLLETGSYYWVDSRGKSILHWSLNWRQEELFGKLLAEDALLHLDPRYPMSSLLWDAIDLGELNFVKAIVEEAMSHNMLAELEINEGLYWTAMTGQKEIAQYLLSKGASLTDVALRHQGVLSAVIRARFFDMAWYLIEQGIRLETEPATTGNALASAIQAGNIELTEFLVKNGFGVNDEVDYEGTTAFSLALGILNTRNDNYELVDLLVRHGGNPCAMASSIPLFGEDTYESVPLGTLLAITENQEFKKYIESFDCSN